MVSPKPWSSQTPSGRGLLEGAGQGLYSLFYVPLLREIRQKDGALTGSAHPFCEACRLLDLVCQEPVLSQDCFLERGGRPSVFFLMRVPSGPLPWGGPAPQPARDLGAEHLGRARDSAFAASSRHHQMRGAGRLFPGPGRGCVLGEGVGRPRVQDRSHVWFSVWGPRRRGAINQERWAMWVGAGQGAWGPAQAAPSAFHTDSFHRPSCRYY